MLCATPACIGLLKLVESLQNLDLPLLEGLLPGLELGFEPLDSDLPARGEMSAGEYFTETATADELIDPVLIPEY